MLAISVQLFHRIPLDLLKTFYDQQGWEMLCWRIVHFEPKNNMISPQASVRFLPLYIPRPFHLAPVFPSAPPLLFLAPSSSSKKRHIRNTAIFQGLCLWLHRQTVQAPSRPNTETLLLDPTGKPVRRERRGGFNSFE